jgi:lipopolysaccharide transport system permease protein
MIGILARGAWTYRGFILANMRRDFAARYTNSVLGATWTVLEPLAMVAIYAIVFSKLMRASLPGATSPHAYTIYLCSGILAWTFFAEIVNRGQNMFIEHANLIKKINFPKVCLPIIVVANSGLHFAIVYALFTLFLLAIDAFPGLPYVALVPVLALQVAFAIGLGVSVGVLNVFFRDVGHLVGILLQFWFWATPIVYPMDVVPEWIRGIILLNPMTGIVEAYHRILVQGEWPHWGDLWPAAIASLLVCSLGLLLFSRRAGEMVDEL